MPRLANKHANAELVTFADLSGGLNLTRPGNFIADNELREAVNFEYSKDSGALKVRGGLVHVRGFDEPVTDIIRTVDADVLLARVGNEIHRADIGKGSGAMVGSVDGDKRASSELWGDGTVLMTFGGRIHIYDGETVSPVTSEGAPEAAEILLVRDGRLWVFESGSDYLRMSGVGDPENWTDDSGDDSTSKSIEVGYKDGLDIDAAALIAGNVIVFKSPPGQPEFGRIYRISGSYPDDLSVTLYSRGSSAWNARSVINAGNDIVYLTREGAANLATVTEYGDFKTGWAGAKVNSKMALTLSEKSTLADLTGAGQAWVLDGVSEDVWVYFYTRAGAPWTTYRFPGPVTAAVSAGNETYLSIGADLYRMDDEAWDDAGTAMEARMKTRVITRRNQVLLKHVFAAFQSSVTAEVLVRLEGLPPELRFCGGRGDIAALDDDIAFLDNEPLWPSVMTSIRHRCCVRRWEIAPEIVVRGGSFSLSKLELEIAEV